MVKGRARVESTPLATLLPRLLR